MTEENQQNQSAGFMDAPDSASEKLDTYTVKDGVNKFRLIGPIVPRYVYWVPNSDGKTIPIECLSFDRNKGRFLDNQEDPTLEFFPNKLKYQGVPVKDKKGNNVPMRASWSYVGMVFDLDEGTPEKPVVKLMYFKKTAYDDIKNLARKKLGDPTHPEEGWDVTLEKKKTGSGQFDVEYECDPFACQEGKRPLTDEEKEAYEDTKSIDELIPRQTPEQQREFIKERVLGEESSNEGTDQDAVNDLDDPPF